MLLEALNGIPVCVQGEDYCFSQSPDSWFYADLAFVCLLLREQRLLGQTN